MEPPVAAALRQIATAPRRRDRGARAYDAADEERAQAAYAIFVFHGTIVEVRISTLGDVMLDVIVRLEEPLAPGGDVRAATRAGAGGQAANVAAWAVALGAEGRCIAKRGSDATGELVARELEGRGVELVGPVADGGNGCRRLHRRRRPRSRARLRPRRRALVLAGGARRGLAGLRRPPSLRLRALREPVSDTALLAASSRAPAARSSPSTSRRGRRSARSARCASAS